MDLLRARNDDGPMERSHVVPGGIAILGMIAALAAPIEPAPRLVLVLLASWLLAAAFLRIRAASPDRQPTERRWIPLQFEGDPGRFRMVARGDGRRVEVRDGPQVVAEAVATDIGDELVINSVPVEDADLEAFGAALGQAIDMAAAADADDQSPREDWRAPGGFPTTLDRGD